MYVWSHDRGRGTFKGGRKLYNKFKSQRHTHLQILSYRNISDLIKKSYEGIQGISEMFSAFY